MNTRTILKNFFSNEMAKKYPVRSIFRFFFLQLYHRLINRPYKFKLLTGTRALAYPHSSGITSYFYFGLPDYEEQKFFLENVRKGDSFIDIGANVGGWSLLAAGRGCKVMAFETVPLAYHRSVEKYFTSHTLKFSYEGIFQKYFDKVHH